MRKLLAFFALLCALSSPVVAADNYQATAGSGLTFRAKDTGAGLLLPYFAPADGSAVSIVYGQGSTTSGQSGFLFLCRTLTAAPTDTTAQSNSPWCTTAGEISAHIQDGSDVTLGAKADAVCGTATGTCSAVQLLKFIANAVNSAIPAGTNLIGKVQGNGTAGTADANVLTVQGIASMTKLLVTPDSVALPANQSVNVSQINGVTPLMGNGVTGTGSPRVTPASDSSAIANWGQGATGATSPTGATQAGVRAQNAEATAVTNGQMAGMAADLVGKPIILPYANPENFLNGQITSAMTGTTSTAVTGMGAQGSGVRNYVTSCTFSNSHATVGTMILLQDGSGGTTLWQAPAAAAFGGAQVIFPTPIKTTANTGLFAANVTTGANTFVSCTGYKGI